MNKNLALILQYENLLVINQNEVIFLSLSNKVATWDLSSEITFYLSNFSEYIFGDYYIYMFTYYIFCLKSTFLNKNILVFYLFIFREGKGGTKRGRETSMCVCLSCGPIGDLACNPGICPDWESNQWPFGSQASAQSTEPHQPGLLGVF